MLRNSSGSVLHELPIGQTEEGELLDLDQDVSVTDTNQPSTEEQNYRETMRDVRSSINWTHVLDIDENMASAEDNPFAAPKQPVGKLSVTLLTDYWLCRKIGSLKLTLLQGYPSAKLNSSYSQIARSSGITGLTYLVTLSDVGRRLQGSPPISVTRHVDSVGT